MPADLNSHAGVLPYASELYGIYQPLLGWRSRRTQQRLDDGIAQVWNRVLADLPILVAPDVEIDPEFRDLREARFRIGVGREGRGVSSLMRVAPQSLIARTVITEVANEGEDSPDVWKQYTSPDFLEHALAGLEDQVREVFHSELRSAEENSREMDDAAQHQLLNSILARESVTAGVLAALGGRDDGAVAMELFNVHKRDVLDRAIGNVEAVIAALDPRRSELASAVISPVGIVHLFRQYFFEFDSFLGPAVEHLWLSPGGMVELVEVSTRKTVIERLTENAFESLLRSEKSLVLDDELSEAVKRHNSSSTKFGVSLNTETSFGLGPVFTAQVGTGTSYDLATNQEEARESLHKAARQQTEFLATEMKRSFKSTFRTTTEISDTRSRSYRIYNESPDLMNYELRRKMRQVGVQMQDYGTFMCWQTYVDTPGDELGVANLVHISVPNDKPPLVQPDLPAEPVPYRGETVKHHFRWYLGDPTSGLGFQGLDPEHFGDVYAGDFPIVPSPGFKLDRVEVKVVGGENWAFQGRGAPGSERPVAPGVAETTHTVAQVFHPPTVQDNPGPRQPLPDGHPEFDFEITPFYVPSQWLLDKVVAEKEQKLADANQEREHDYKEKMFTAIKERVKLASNVQPRPFGDLRDEERIIVYRNLIRQLMSESGVSSAEPQVHHLFAELVQSMFDIDKMLYFVAPEWWMPRNRSASQDIFRPDANQSEFATYSAVSWGGGRGLRDDNYYVTEDSAPARLGSSLGWIIQLDGDNLRNAFLNAPWVKAVVPIRPGKEDRALGWLQGASVEGSDGLDAAHDAPTEELDRIRGELGLAAGATVTIKDAIDALILRLQERQKTARSTMVDENGAELGYMPMDEVYENGFDPLQGGFKIPPGKDFEVFDQWLEVVPTDQIVPVPVKYDPKTGRME